MKINTNSNSYTIIYASVMVIIVAFLLTFVNLSLKKTQEDNVKLDTKKQILSALHINNVVDADAEYKKAVKADKLLLTDGSFDTVAEADFATNYEAEAKVGRLHIFEAEVEGETKYVFPVYGKGLWGGIWGYVALNADRNTVFGVYFSHASETPGLGAEITSDGFKSQFSGREAMANGEVALTVVKNGKVTDALHEVDGISGGTITSMGVKDMLHDCLNNYKVFLTANQEEE